MQLAKISKVVGSATAKRSPISEPAYERLTMANSVSTRSTCAAILKTTVILCTLAVTILARVGIVVHAILDGKGTGQYASTVTSAPAIRAPTVGRALNQHVNQAAFQMGHLVIQVICRQLTLTVVNVRQDLPMGCAFPDGIKNTTPTPLNIHKVVVSL